MQNYIFNEGSNFICNKLIKGFNIIIEKNVEVVGDNLTIQNEIIIKSNSIFVNITFVNSTIYVESGAIVQFENCIFRADDSPSIIMVYNSHSILSVRNCIFENKDTSIIINNNFVEEISNTKFMFSKVAIEILDFNYLGEVRNNLLFSYSNSVFIKIESSKKRFVKALLSSKELSNKNNSAVIECYSSEEILIRTSSYYVCTYSEFIDSLEKCNNGSTIIVKTNVYYGDIIINKSITIIGEEDVKFVPSINKKNIAAFIISAPKVVIKNINIDANENGSLKFRDGIKYSNSGGDECVFENINIKNIRRRGISIWGKNTTNTKINQCIICNSSREGVFIWRNVNIEKTEFHNCYVAITNIFNNDIVLRKCTFNNIKVVMIINNENIGEIVLDDNYFGLVAELVKNNE